MQPGDLYERIGESVQWLRENGVGQVDTGIILGSGLSQIAHRIERIITIPYPKVPHLAGTAVTSHKGEIVYGTFNGEFVLIFAGRIHYYEGYEMWQVAYPVRLIKALGGVKLITTAAAGGLNPDFEAGDIVMLSDHISLMPASPLRGRQDPRLGDRFPDMSSPYDQASRTALKAEAIRRGLVLREGVYLGLQGPSLETRAEYIFLHRIGADLVGMSVVPEVIVGVQSGLTIVGLCVVSNVCYPPDRVKKTTIENVVMAVESAADKLCELILS